MDGYDSNVMWDSGAPRERAAGQPPTPEQLRGQIQAVQNALDQAAEHANRLVQMLHVVNDPEPLEDAVNVRAEIRRTGEWAKFHFEGWFA